MKKEFHHIGIPTSKQQPDEIHLEAAKLFITDAGKSEHHIEWLRFEPGSPMHPLLQSTAHVAYCVADLDAAIAGKPLVMAPFSPMAGVRVAFVQEGDAPVEYLEFKSQE